MEHLTQNNINAKVSDKNIKDTQNLIDFISASPTAFHTVQNIVRKLAIAEYAPILQDTEIIPGGKYYITKNFSSVIAFRIPEKDPSGFMICAAHSDSPSFKIKPVSVSVNGKYLKLNIEKYGGMINNTWLDRPLSVAGRVSVSESYGIKSVNIDFKKDFCLIPNLAIHMNNEINNGFKYNSQTDLQPIFSVISNTKGDLNECLLDEVAKELNVESSDILDYDLYLYNNQKGSIWGNDNQFFSAPRIDDLQCVYSAMTAFINTEEFNDSSAVPVLAIFDNEEVGSETKQGAASVFFSDVLDFITDSLSCNKLKKISVIKNSMMLSADNAHAIHPNHPEKTDGSNFPTLNHGVVIKYNANQRYTTDSVSAAIFKKIINIANIPYQVFANRSDMVGGSTLGSIANTKVPIKTVDIGAPQLAMHSCFETAGSKDTTYLIDAMTEFYKTNLTVFDNKININ